VVVHLHERRHAGGPSMDDRKEEQAGQR